MTSRRNDPLKRKPLDEGEAKLLADVKDPGWHVIGVAEDDDGPGFVYSIGLYHNYRHPEIIAFGLDVQILWHMVNIIGDKAKAGKKFDDNHEMEDVLDGYLVFFRAVEQRHYPEYFGYARWFYEGDDFPALQCVWPDKSHRYPWHPDASQAFRDRQPLLCDAASWRFQEGRNRAVSTTKSVIHEAMPVLLVSHDAGGDWQFFSGPKPQVESAALVSLGSLVQIDPTLMEVADLPEGWQASRTGLGNPWKRKKG